MTCPLLSIPETFGMEAPLEVYIVRVYRREDGDPRIIAGIVEEPGKAVRKAFADMNELCDFLSRKKRSKASVTQKDKSSELPDSREKV